MSDPETWEACSAGVSWKAELYKPLQIAIHGQFRRDGQAIDRKRTIWGNCLRHWAALALAGTDFQPVERCWASSCPPKWAAWLQVVGKGCTESVMTFNDNRVASRLHDTWVREILCCKSCHRGHQSLLAKQKSHTIVVYTDAKPYDAKMPPMHQHKRQICFTMPNWLTIPLHWPRFEVCTYRFIKLRCYIICRFMNFTVSCTDS